jgi:Ca-activated chloride channel family protein
MRRLPWLLIAALFVPLAAAYALLLRNVGGFRFAHPWVLAAIPPAVALVLWTGLARAPAWRALFVYSRAMELAAQRPGIVARLRDLPTVLRLAVVVLVAVAAARPQSTRTHDDLELEGIDIVITLDLSGSMQETDLAPNRLEAAKSVIREFVRKRPTDRIGMVVFGREAYTYVPLTLDHGTLLRMLAELRLGIVDGNGTAIGNGIGVALNRLCSEELTALRRASEQGEGAAAQKAKPPAPVVTGPDGKPRSRVIIVLTDGDNNAGNVSPEDAARWAQLLNVKIYTVLAGTSDGEASGAAPGGGRHAANPKLLEQIASTTGGTPYLATDRRALDDRFQKILEDLHKSRLRDRGTLYAELYPRFLIVAFALLLLEIALRQTRFLRIP